MGDRLRVLVVEDRPADAELVLRELRRAGYDLDWRRVDTERDYLAALGPELDVILADYHLPQLDAPRVLELLQGSGLDVPLVVVSGTLGDELAAGCIKLGAADYLLKDRLGRLGSAVAQALDAKRLRRKRRKAEEALRDSEERFRSAFDDSAIGMALQGLDGRYQRVNRALCELLGYSMEALLATTYVAITHPGDRDADFDRNSRMLTGEIRAYQMEKRYVGGQGHVVWALVTVSLVRDRHGQPLYYVSQVQDLTERRRAEEAEARLQAQLVQSEKLAAMGSLLAGVAHELNNPLSVVLGQATLLRQKVGEGPLGIRADKIARAAERCARIVRNFLALARERPPERQRVALNEVVEAALELVAYGFRVDDVEARLELAADVPPLWADPHQLHQVLVNLLTNAHQAMRHGAGPRVVTVTTRLDAARGRVVLEVRDTGPGIPPEIQPRIFEPFFTTKPPGEGTGLGLSLCQGIVEAHGGTIGAESAPGAGAVFRVELPLTAPTPVDADVEEPPGAPPPPGKRILVVDDESEVAAVLADMLAQDGHQVDTAASGAAALARLAERDYELILSDMKMPDLDGPGLLRAAAARNARLAQRFVFLTGDGLTPETRRFLEESQRPSLSKPFTIQDVRRAVQRALHVGRMTA